MYALRERRVHVTQEDFEMAVTKVGPHFYWLVYLERNCSKYLYGPWSFLHCRIMQYSILLLQACTGGSSVIQCSVSSNSNRKLSFLFNS